MSRTKSSRTPFKREATQAAGLLTPNASMSSLDSGTLLPKQEEHDEKLSNTTEASAVPFKSHDGLPPQSAEPMEQEQKPLMPIDVDADEEMDARVLRSPSRKFGS
jgi:hypothetical protein